MRQLDESVHARRPWHDVTIARRPVTATAGARPGRANIRPPRDDSDIVEE